MEIIESKQGETPILKVIGRLDSKTSLEFEKKVLESIQNGSKNVLIDCDELDYISSAGLRVLNKGAKKLKPADGRIILFAMEDYIREVFEIAGFDTFLPIVPGLDDALGAI
ncbi:MAG: STAS domain-containing protein [Desulfobacterales bacterium]|nr:STAS domain-containing protein [Desulfobacterales bacterium]